MFVPSHYTVKSLKAGPESFQFDDGHVVIVLHFNCEV